MCAYDIKLGSDIINFSNLQESYPHLEPVFIAEYRYADLETILGQDFYEYVRPIKYCRAKNQTAPFVVLLPIVWLLSGPLLSSSDLHVLEIHPRGCKFNRAGQILV